MLVLLIVSVAVHFVLTGLGLWFFGAEGSRTPAFATLSFELGRVNIVISRGSSGEMRVRREPIPEMPAALKQIVEEMK